MEVGNFSSTGKVGPGVFIPVANMSAVPSTDTRFTFSNTFAPIHTYASVNRFIIGSVMACHLFGAKVLPEPMLTSVKFELRGNFFYNEYILKYR